MIKKGLLIKFCENMKRRNGSIHSFHLIQEKGKASMSFQKIWKFANANVTTYIRNRVYLCTICSHPQKINTVTRFNKLSRRTNVVSHEFSSLNHLCEMNGAGEGEGSGASNTIETFEITSRDKL